MVRNQSPKLLSSSRLETVFGGGLGSLFNTTIIISTMMSTTMMRGMMMRMMGMGTTITG